MMNRLKILIIGNISSGKSTLVDKLSRLDELVDFEVVKIDEEREKYGDGSFSKECLSWYYFLDKIENERSMLIEFSGAGPYKHSIRQILNQSELKIIVIYVSTSLVKCIENSLDRDFNTPYPWKMNIDKAINSIQLELEYDWNDKFWHIFKTNILTDTEKLMKFIRSELYD